MSDELSGWGPPLDEIERRTSAGLGMGGEARLARQEGAAGSR